LGDRVDRKQQAGFKFVEVKLFTVDIDGGNQDGEAQSINKVNEGNDPKSRAHGVADQGSLCQDNALLETAIIFGASFEQKSDFRVSGWDARSRTSVRILRYHKNMEMSGVTLMSNKLRPLIESSEVGNLDPEEIRAVVSAVHVVPSPNGWVVRKSGTDRIHQLFATKEQAENFAQELSAQHHVEIMVHSRIPEPFPCKSKRSKVIDSMNSMSG
jgi:hypothetical protein